MTSNHVRTNTLVDSTRNLVQKKKEGNENTINKEKSTKQIDVKTSNLFLLVRARIVSRGMHTPSIRGFESSTILESKKKEKKKYRSRQRLSLDASVTIHRDERNSGLNRSISILSKTRPLDLTLSYIEKKNLQKSRMQFRRVFLFFSFRGRSTPLGKTRFRTYRIIIYKICIESLDREGLRKGVSKGFAKGIRGDYFK